MSAALTVTYIILFFKIPPVNTIHFHFSKTVIQSEGFQSGQAWKPFEPDSTLR